MKKLLTIRFTVVVVIFALISGTHVFAGALSTSGQGSRPVSMGGAFTAVADDGACIYYNPAGMSQINGTDIEVGMSLILPKIKYEMQNGAVQESTKAAFGPSLFFTHAFTDKFNAGLGIYSPYAREANFGDDLANGFLSQNSKMVRTDFSPVVSYQLFEQISAGIGLIGSYGVIDQSIPAGPTLRINDKSDGFGLGGIAGLLWKINEYIKVGGTYRSRMTVNQHGDRKMEQDGAAITSDASTDVHYPSSLGMGIAIMPIEKLTLALDGDWYEWSYMKTITTKTDLWPDSTAVLNTDNSWDIRIGGEYKLPKDWAVRAGYAYIQGAIPNTTIMPCKPDANAHELDIGIGKYWRHWKVELNYEYLFANEEQSSANIYGYDGKYNITQHIIGLEAAYIF
ncbi:MAG: outer membrane protein transport protein [Verrucomicrobiota bacterium]